MFTRNKAPSRTNMKKLYKKDNNFSSNSENRNFLHSSISLHLEHFQKNVKQSNIEEDGAALRRIAGSQLKVTKNKYKKN